jgi:hypothetical protein
LNPEHPPFARLRVEREGSLFATGATSLFNEWGDARPDFALADLFACHRAGDIAAAGASGGRTGSADPIGAFAPSPSGHTYLRLLPEVRARVEGPKAGDEPPITGTRHAVLRGFEETDIIAYGGSLAPLRVDKTALVPLTFVPPFPTSGCDRRIRCSGTFKQAAGPEHCGIR